MDNDIKMIKSKIKKKNKKTNNSKEKQKRKAKNFFVCPNLLLAGGSILGQQRQLLQPKNSVISVNFNRGVKFNV